LHALLDPDLMRELADFAEQPPLTVSADRKTRDEHKEFIEKVWTRFEAFFRAAEYAPRQLTGIEDFVSDTKKLESTFHACLDSAMRIPDVEAVFSKPWPLAARRVLPNQSPHDTAAALWGPAFAWCAIDCMAYAINPRYQHRVALELFDRLRLREPLGKAFQDLGIEGEAAWRAAARIKTLLLANSVASSVAVDQAKPVNGDRRFLLPPSLWSDPDVRWLTGVHDSDGRNYLVKEPFEELLWWLQLPALLKLATKPERAAAGVLVGAIDEAIAAVEASGYEPDRLLNFDRRGRKPDAGAAKTTTEATKAPTTEAAKTTTAEPENKSNGAGKPRPSEPAETKESSTKAKDSSLETTAQSTIKTG
jgi:hypothetical protein